MNASLPPTFVMTYPYSVFTQLNITLVRLHGATSLRDNKWADLLAQWISLSPLIWTSFSEAMEHTPFNELHKSKVQAIRAHAEARVPAPCLTGLLLELGYTGAASLWGLGKSHTGETPTPLAVCYPSHNPFPHGTQRGSRGSLRLRRLP